MCCRQPLANIRAGAIGNAVNPFLHSGMTNSLCIAKGIPSAQHLPEAILWLLVRAHMLM